jgi:hypothetical protein
VVYVEARPVGAVTFDFDAQGIAAIYFVSNPDKLRHLPPLEPLAS